MTNIVPLRPYDPIPWETFAEVSPPRPNPVPSKFWKAFACLCVLAALGGALFAFSH